MKPIFFTPALIASLCVFSHLLVAQQEADETIIHDFDDVVTRWDLLSSELGKYEGLDKYCTQREYQEEVINVLNNIHHYDSLLYRRVSQKARFNNSHELKKTLEQIEQFEDEYKSPSFIKKLHDECAGRRDIEKDSKETRNDIGENSYDGQVMVLEADLSKYIVHITKLVDHIKEHLHHLETDK